MHHHQLPTYGELIDLLSAAEQQHQSINSSSLSEILVANFKTLYPNISIGRPDRFLDTVRRIAASTTTSILGRGKLAGSPLRKILFEEEFAIPYSCKGKQRPNYQIIEEFSTYLGKKCAETTSCDMPLAAKDPYYIVGKKIRHRFCQQDTPSEIIWYIGFVLEYDEQQKHHIVQYEGEDELQCFDLTIDVQENLRWRVTKFMNINEKNCFRLELSQK